MARPGRHTIARRPTSAKADPTHSITIDQRMVALDAGRHADAADARQLERRPPNIKAEHCTKEVDLETLDPPDCKTEIAPK